MVEHLEKEHIKHQSVQNFAARVITGIRKYDHVMPILQQLAWLPVECILKLRDAVMTFECVKGLAPPYFCDKFEMRSKTRSVNSRNKDKLDIPLYNSASEQRTFHKRHFLHGFLESIVNSFRQFGLV